MHSLIVLGFLMCLQSGICDWLVPQTLTNQSLNNVAGSLPDKGELNNSNHLFVKSVNFIREKVGFYWPLGIVPYEVDGNNYESKFLRNIMNSIETVSCIQFRSYLKVPDKITWLNFTNPEKIRACVHEPERLPSGEVKVVLGLDCLKTRDVTHTLLHAIGFKDEITHPNRDKYVKVLWENIQIEYQPLFRRQTNEMSSKNLVEYDPLSIMQFHDRAFSVNGQATIVPVYPGLQINPSHSLSQLDVMKLRLMFNHECNKRKVSSLLESCKKVLNNDNKIKNDASKPYVNSLVGKGSNNSQVPLPVKFVTK